MTCPQAHLDASYLLGALSPAEREGYERHLRECEECQGAVQRLAGLPGLLARVPVGELPTGEPVPPVPETLPRLVRSVRRHQRRRYAGVAVAAAATAALVVGGAAALRWPDAPVAGPPSDTVAAVLRSPDVLGTQEDLDDVSLAMRDVLWGTRLDLTCSYSEEYVPADGRAYSLVVRTRNGAVTQVGTWRALPGHTMTVTAATDAPVEEIRWIEMRTKAGDPVVRWVA